MDETVKVQELNADELFQEWEAEQKACSAGRPVTRDTRTVKHRRDWASNRIWVHNLSGCDVVVFADRYSTVMDIVKAGLELGAGTAGGKVAANVERAQRTARCTMKVLSSDNRDKEQICLGAGDKAGFVTVCKRDDIRQLFCKDEIVPTGSCLVVLNSNTVLDPVLMGADTAV